MKLKSLYIMLPLFLEIFFLADVLNANKAHQILFNKSNQARNEALTVLFFQTEEDCDFVGNKFSQGLSLRVGRFGMLPVVMGIPMSFLLKMTPEGQQELWIAP